MPSIQTVVDGYGAPKIFALLKQEGYTGSIDRVQRIMKQAGIRSNIVKKYKPTSSSSNVEERENLLAQDFTTETINEKWVADITYIHTVQDGWCYLASVQDLHTKKIVGYKFGRRMTMDLVLDALENAVMAQQPALGLILHTDLGVQFNIALVAFFINYIHYKIKPKTITYYRFGSYSGIKEMCLLHHH